MSNISVSEMHNASILEEMAPAIVQNLIDAQSKEHVFFLKDAIAMIATLEYLVISESARTLDEVYHMEGLAEHTSANASLVQRLLVRYAVGFELPTETHRIDGILEKIFKQGKMKDFFLTPTQDIIGNFEYARGLDNPFTQDFSFEDTLAMVTEFQKSYGRRQMEECTLMKEELAMRDESGMGRVPLHRFYAEENAISDIFKFGESKEYLREIGALDESDSSRPKVIIPNYVQGPWNCLARSGYYAICCVNECEGLVNSIEDFFGTPTVEPEALLEMVGNMSSASVEGPRKLSGPLQKKLHDIANLHNGEVPIYGRLFAQWIHFAFPYECPYPSLHSSSIKKDLYMPGRVIGTATNSEKMEAENQALLVNATLEDNSDDRYDALWDDMEILHLTHQKKHPVARTGMRIIVLLAAFASVCVSLAGVVKQMQQINCPGKAEGGKSDRLMV
jgi:hypothetical protein